MIMLIYLKITSLLAQTEATWRQIDLFLSFNDSYSNKGALNVGLTVNDKGSLILSYVPQRFDTFDAPTWQRGFKENELWILSSVS